MCEGPHRYIPRPTRQALRQEAYFGCAKCGNPILDYHHIIPWSERKHNDPKHMVAVCPTHHREIGKRPREYAYELKSNPHNKAKGIICGYLATDKMQSSFILGSTKYTNTPTIFSYYQVPIFSYRIVDGQALLSAYIPADDFWPDIEIVDNDISAQIEAFWDIEFRINYVKFRKKKRETFLEIDLAGEDAVANGNITINNENYTFGRSATQFQGVKISGGHIDSCGAGIAVGKDRTKLLRPNYAMRIPAARFVQL